MILNYLMQFACDAFSTIIRIVSFGQQVDKIPLFDSYLVTGFGWWNAFLAEFPPLQIVWTLFIWYLMFEIALVIVKLFLGHRITI